MLSVLWVLSDSRLKSRIELSCYETVEFGNKITTYHATSWWEAYLGGIIAEAELLITLAADFLVLTCRQREAAHEKRTKTR